MHRLITIRISHYNEKARWALDRFGVPYREQGYMPLFHAPPVAWAVRRGSDAAADHMSTRLSTPVLVTDDGQRICDSSRIVRWASTNHAGPGEDLYPDPASEQLEARFSQRLGQHTRLLAYYWLLGDAPGMRALARANVGRAQSLLFAAVFPLGRAFVRRGLSVDGDHAARSRRIVLEEVAFASEALVGQRYLTAGRFTVADLALACMLAPSLLVSPAEGYGAVLPAVEESPPDAAAFAREIRATPAGAHALRMFREERGARSILPVA